MRKGFLIIFDEKHPSMNEINEFHNTLTKDPDVLAWWHHITNTYIIITTSKANVTSITNFIQGKMPKTQHLVLEIKYSSYEGWLPRKAWDWFENSLKNVQ